MPSPCRALAASLLLIGPASAQLAGVYTVNPLLPASATNFTSLQAAVTALNGGGVAGPVFFDVYDDAGPYTESHPFTTTNGPFPPSTAGLAFAQWTGVSSTNRVTFRAAAGESPVIDASANAFGVFWNGADYVTLEGFEIENAPFDGISLYTEAAAGQAVEPVITGCRVHHCGGAGVAIYGNTPSPLNTLVENCFFWHLETTNVGSFSTTGRFGYVTTRRATGTRIIGNTFFADTGAGSSFCVIGSYTSSVSEIPYAEVRDNVVVKTAASGKPLLRYQTPAGAITPVPPIEDGNCFWDPTGSPFAFYGANAGTTAQLLLDWQLATNLDLASLAADPALLDPAHGELHLLAGSPCIGAGLLPGPAADIDGQPRTGAIDIGADQFSAATIASVGAGCPGTNGLVPVLYSHEWPFLGNAGFAVLLGEAPPGALLLGFISLGMGPPFPLGGGCNAYLSLPTTATIPGFLIAGPAGTAGRLIPLPGSALLAGTAIGLQYMVVDTGAPLGFTATNALSLVLGF